MRNTCILLMALFFASYGNAQTWYEVSVPTSHRLNAIDFPSNDVGYIVGDSTTVLKTIDGGVTWSEINHSGLSGNSFSHEISDVKFVDEQTGFLTMLNDNDGAFKTTDGGLTWTPAANSGSNMCFKACVYATSEDDYFVGGAGCFQSGQIDQYTNPNWSISTVNYDSFNPDEYIKEMDFNGNIGLAVMNGKYMLRSVDSGVTWDTLPEFVMDGVLTSIMFASPDTVYAGYENPILYGFGFLMSTDAGQTWQSQSTIGFFYPAARGFAKAANGDLYAGGITAGDFGLVFESTDNGLSWSETQVMKPLNAMASYDADVTFAVGDSGYVVVNTILGNVGIEEMNTEELTVYPNPTTGEVFIQTAGIATEDFVLLDLQGRIQTVEFEQIQDTVKLNMTQLPEGIYIIRSTGDPSRSYRIVKI